MKKILVIIAIIMATGSFVSCIEGDENAALIQQQIDQEATNGEDEKVNTDDE